jgi:hypothetical protein
VTGSAAEHVNVVVGLGEAGAEASVPVERVRRSHVGEHLPGTIGGGHFTWDALVGPDVTAASLARPGLDVVLLETPLGLSVPEPGIRDAVKRTLLLRVEDGTDPERVHRFEQELAGMPRHIGAIRNWSLARVLPNPSGWTHAWEQEYADLDGLRVDYMRHPYHWAVIDRWFDPEHPDRIVDPALAHVFCATESSILAWRI